MKEKKPTTSAREGSAPPRKPRAQIIEEAIDRAVRPYAGILPPEGLRIMRERVADTLATHPEALAALAAMEAAPAADQSGKRPRGEGGSGDEGAS
jgi:hypothetical protein